MLSTQSRAYYHWIQGALAAGSDDDLEFAEEQMKLAIDGELRTPNDRCIATAILSKIAFLNNEPERARQILADAYAIEHKDATNEFLGQLAAELASSK